MIVYETPKFGVHHFLLHFGSSSEQVKSPLAKPKWANELHNKQLLLDMVFIVLRVVFFFFFFAFVQVVYFVTLFSEFSKYRIL